MKFKGKGSSELLSLDEAVKLEEYAGILNDDTVMIDVDDFEISEKFMDIVEYKQLNCLVTETNKGKHFFFRNGGRIERNKTNTMTICGLPTDIKTGENTSYSVLKYNGIQRSIAWEPEVDGEYDVVPYYFLPIKYKKNFWGMKNSDGRNQELFNYILTLQCEGLEKENIKECIRIINRFVFSDPLPSDELEVILRDEAFQKPIFFNKSTFLFDKFAMYLRSEYHIIRIDNVLHIYQDGVYVPGHNRIEAEMIKHIPNLNQQKRKEVLAYLELLVDENKKVAPAQYIAFRNGIYDLDTGIMEPYTASKIITNKIDHDFIPNSYHKLADDSLNKFACGDKNIRKLLEEIIGYSMFRRNELRKFFFFLGEASNGKSTFLSMLKTMLGESNISALDLKELNDRFRTAEMYGKLVNIGDDVDDDYIRNTAVIKKLVSGDPVTVERKGRDPFVLNNYSKLFFSGNSVPRMGKGKDSGALISRLVIVPFDAKFNSADKNFDPFIKDKLVGEDCMRYLIQVGINGLKRVLHNRVFTTTERMATEMKEFEESNNPIISFFDEFDGNILHESTSVVYARYSEYCMSSNVSPLSKIEFSKQVKRKYGFITKVVKLNGQCVRVFEKGESDKDED